MASVSLLSADRSTTRHSGPAAKAAMEAARTGAGVCWLGWSQAGLPEWLEDAAMLVAGGWPAEMDRWPVLAGGSLGLDEMACVVSAYSGLSLTEASEALGRIPGWQNLSVAAVLTFVGDLSSERSVPVPEGSAMSRIDKATHLVIAGARADCRAKSFEICVWLGVWLSQRARDGRTMVVVLEGFEEWDDMASTRAIDALLQNLSVRADLTVLRTENQETT